MAYENGTELDNIAITQSIIEANQWIAKVKADKRKWGKWSVYYWITDEDLEPIIVHKGGINNERNASYTL